MLASKFTGKRRSTTTVSSSSSPATTSPILIDSREPLDVRKAVQREAAQVGVAAHPLELETGDFLWSTPEGQSVVVERKTVSDLLHSFRDHRWNRQLSRMLAYDVPIVLVEGNIDYYFDTRGVQGWTRASVDAALVSAQLAGIYLAHTPKGEVAARVVGLYEQTHRESTSILPRKRKLVNTVGLEMLMTLPGLGLVTARKLLERAGSVGAVLDAIRTGDTAIVGGVRGHQLIAWRRALGEGYEDQAA